MSKLKTHEQYILELSIKCPNIRAIDIYVSDSIKIKHKCIICGYIWSVKPSNILQGKGCPVCGHHIIGPPPAYRNSIWNSEYKNLFSQYMTEEQMKTIMPHSGKKIMLPCLDCGELKSITPANLINEGFRCMCGDGQSFPNKFVYNVLKQLGIKVKPEYSPDWAGLLRYDDYLIDYNIIIENHGLQHYEDVRLRRTLKDEQRNDLIKYNLAKDNNINDYIIIDCRKSTMEEMKRSIMNSKLPKILKFSEADVDWLQATQYATHSLVKTAAEMFNKGDDIKTISNELQKNISTIRTWLKQATKIGWCTYIPKQVQEIYCIELHKIFETKSKAAKETHTSVASIINNLKGLYSYAGRHSQNNQPLHWLSIDDAINLGYIHNTK